MTAEERSAVRALVERACEQQHVPLVVPPEVARSVAAMIAVSRPRPNREDAGHAPAAG